MLERTGVCILRIENFYEITKCHWLLENKYPVYDDCTAIGIL